MGNSNSTESLLVARLRAGTMTILVDGAPRRVLNAFSSGPGCTPHTYDLIGREYVYEIAGEWKLQRPGQFPVVVVVSL